MDAYTDSREAKPLTHRETLLIVLGVLLPTFMGSLDQTILATALPTIGRDFDDTHSLPWLITAYLLASTAVIPLYGKIADIHGRRFTLRIAIMTYIAGSLVCALAPNMLVLIPSARLAWAGRGQACLHGNGRARRSRRPRSAAAITAISPRPTPPPAARAASWRLDLDHLHWSVIFWINIPWGLPRSRSPTRCCAGSRAMSGRTGSTSWAAG
jgi:MFS family permease